MPSQHRHRDGVVGQEGSRGTPERRSIDPAGRWGVCIVLLLRWEDTRELLAGQVAGLLPPLGSLWAPDLHVLCCSRVNCLLHLKGKGLPRQRGEVMPPCAITPGTWSAGQLQGKGTHMDAMQGGIPAPVHLVSTVLWGSLLLPRGQLCFFKTRSLPGDPLPKCEVPGRLCPLP